MSKVELYQKAIIQFSTAHMNLANVISRLETVHCHLDCWERERHRLSGSGLKTILESWPSKQEFEQAVDFWNTSSKNMEFAFDDIPTEEKTGLIRPDLIDPRHYA